jgi:polypyrimidine tract-binding protein 2
MKLVELGKPFGKIVNTKVNVGANHNQRFVEFVSVSLLIDSLFVCIILSLPWI